MLHIIPKLATITAINQAPVHNTHLCCILFFIFVSSFEIRLMVDPVAPRFRREISQRAQSARRLIPAAVRVAGDMERDGQIQIVAPPDDEPAAQDFYVQHR
jgi:hypothetical protein